MYPNSRNGDARDGSASVVAKIVIVLALVAAVGVVLSLKRVGQRNAVDTAALTGLPRLVDLGAGICVPCKMMAPILDALKRDFAGKLEVVFIDVFANKDAVEKYGITTIPSQIFYDASGKERFRHEGFFSREDILEKWKELGVDLGAGASLPAK